jgi:hypothetical protein
MSKDKPTFEDAVALLADKPTPSFLAQNSLLFYTGLIDLRDRVANLEHLALEATFKIAALEGASNATVDRVNTIEAQHTEYKKRVEVVEQAPAVNDKKIEALETRVRTVEGAVGSTGYKTALAKPDEAKPATPQTGFGVAKPGTQPFNQTDHPQV